MNLDQTLAALKADGKASTARIYRRHGVRGETWGVSYASLAKFQRQLKHYPELALGLWDSGVHDARVLATKIADADSLGQRHLSRWMRETEDHVCEGAVAALAARSPHALGLARKWSKQKGEWVAAGGFNVFAQLAHNEQLALPEARDLLARVEREIASSENRVRYAMNATLIAIGGALAELTEEALRVADAIDAVEVDHGATGCKTPDARSYIAKMRAHRAKRGAARGSAAKGASAKRASLKPKRSASASRSKPQTAENVVVQNVNIPGSRSRVDASKYMATKRALLKVLPRRGEGLRQAEMLDRAKAHLPDALFPGGAKSGWWVKTVQLDLEAKGLVQRQLGRPLRWRRA